MNQTDQLDCVFATWSPTLGDPTVIGWVTVVSYFAGVLLALFAAQASSGGQRRFWLGLVVLLFVLGINKQLDLQSAFTAVGRCLSQSQGWYDQRQTVQIAFIVAVIGTSLAAGTLLSWSMRHHLKHVWLALTGVVFLLGFVVIRAAGFHHFDRFLGYEIGFVRMNWLLEIGGIFAIITNALIISYGWRRAPHE